MSRTSSLSSDPSLLQRVRVSVGVDPWQHPASPDDEALWQRFKAACKADGRTLTGSLRILIATYCKESARGRYR